MDITIKPLVPELAADYFYFFDNLAFSDRKGVFCYCTWFHFDCTIEEHYKHGKDVMRDQAAAYIANGKLNGYLAFFDGIPTGWCNADDKTFYRRLEIDSFIHCNSIERVKAVVCFEIAPEYRGKGIATALLKRVLQDASSLGYTAVEGYPILNNEHNPYNYPGPIRLYEKTGFMEVARQNDKVIMRKMLDNSSE